MTKPIDHTPATKNKSFNAWNPGLQSELPRQLIERQSIFEQNNIENTLQEIKELSDYSGLSYYELADFSLTRLIVHETLVWVTVNLTVPDGPRYEDLGLNMRRMVGQLLHHTNINHLNSIEQSWQQMNISAKQTITNELSNRRSTKDDVSEKPTVKPLSLTSIITFIHRIFRPYQINRTDSQGTDKDLSDNDREHKADQYRKSCIACLNTVIQRIESTRGSLMLDSDIVITLAMIRFRQVEGCRQLRKWLHPILLSECERLEYRLLPTQSNPCVLNVKGASASGKSTLRPLQRKLANRLSLNWEDFAIISPDYWRKYLLDYESLEEDYKYAGSLTGQELAIVDKKLDAYMADKAAISNIPHLLIDRFRFDSFSSIEEREIVAKLLTRFGHTIYLFFVVTSPHNTVERAWTRGIETGRYKSVEDLLYHNVEAYRGIPDLFLSWLVATDKQIHFEFLNNDVEKGLPPVTIASGRRTHFTVYDIISLQKIVLFRNININAQCPQDVYEKSSNDETRQWQFIWQLINMIDEVWFVNPFTEQPYGMTKSGKWHYLNIDNAPEDNQTRNFLKHAITANHLDKLNQEERTTIANDRTADSHSNIGVRPLAT